MARIAIIGATLCLAAGVAACDAPSPSGLDPSALSSTPGVSASVQRVVSGHFEGGDEYGDACGGGLGVWLTSTGTGVVTHLGKTVMVSTLCVNLTDFSIIGDAPVVLRAANGDEVQGLLTGVTYTDYGFDIETVVTGGTGRFENATGELVYPTRSTGTGVWHSGLEGWLRY